MLLPILSIDIETGGPMPTLHPLMAIGTCFRSRDGKKTKRRFCFEFDVRKFDQECYDNFWGKHLATLEFIKAEAAATPISIAQFAAYIDELDAANPDLIILTDNPTFDINIIDYYYMTQLQRTIRYTLSGKYRGSNIVDQNSYLWALMPEKRDPWIYDRDVITKYNLVVNSQKTHLPDDDAEQILDLFVAMRHAVLTRSLL